MVNIRSNLRLVWGYFFFLPFWTGKPSVEIFLKRTCSISAPPKNHGFGTINDRFCSFISSSVDGLETGL